MTTKQCAAAMVGYVSMEMMMGGEDAFVVPRTGMASASAPTATLGISPSQHNEDATVAAGSLNLLGLGLAAGAAAAIKGSKRAPRRSCRAASGPQGLSASVSTTSTNAFAGGKGAALTSAPEPGMSRGDRVARGVKLANWQYTGPAHVGTLRVASSFKNVHAVMHAPDGDDYFNEMRSMLEKQRDLTPQTAVKSSILKRHVLDRGSQEKVAGNTTSKDKEDRNDLILLTPTCASSQEDLADFCKRAAESTGSDVMLSDVNMFRNNEHQAADRTLAQVVQHFMEKADKEGVKVEKSERPSVNILGSFTNGFHNSHDCRELRRMMSDMGIDTNLVVPEGCSVNDLHKLPRAWFNIVPYREVGLMSATYLQETQDMPYIDICPMGCTETARFVRSIASILEPRGHVFDFEKYINEQTRFVSQLAWFSRSIDCQNLTDKRTVVFGDASHAAAMTKILVKEMGIKVIAAGTYCKNDEEWFREQVSGLCEEVLITDDNKQVADMITRIEPAAIFATQFERNIGKSIDVPCGVISAPVHIQNYPLTYRPFLGYEGTNQLADLIYNSFTLGMEDHLLEIFGGHDTKEILSDSLTNSGEKDKSAVQWTPDGLEELNKIPGFVRGKIKKKTEMYAEKNGITEISMEVIFAAKEAVGA